MMIERIHFYHTNDIHSHFENWPQINHFLLEKRKTHTEQLESCYVFDIGDHVDRSNPFTEGTNGQGNVQLLNAAQYDAVTIGNNEGITMSKEALNHLYEHAKFDVVLGNVVDEDGEYPEWVVPTKVVETIQGTKIGIIGATARYEQFYSLLGWSVFPPREQLRAVAEHLAKETDLIVCLSHMGIREDERLALECPAINVILGAHTHHLFKEGQFVGKTLLGATGKFGEFVGHIEVQFDTNTKHITSMQAQVFETVLLPVPKDEVVAFQQTVARGKEAMEEKVFYNPQKMSQRLFSKSPLSSFFGRAIIEHTNADCAIFNAGIFLGSLDEGWVTRRDLHSLLPHPINLCTIALDGAQLLEIFEQSLTEEWPKLEIKGLGFRGTVMGAMIHERLFLNRHGQLFAGNREVVAGEIYTLVTLDMFTFGFFYPLLKEVEKKYYMPELIRDVLGKYGQSYFHNTPSEHSDKSK